MSDFNFVVNSLWPDIVEKFELQLPMVFSAGKGYYTYRLYLWLELKNKVYEGKNREHVTGTKRF